jgi:NAD(P)-dependent dehydrogenase (short-subunit alcohol dehydrogenase family)
MARVLITGCSSGFGLLTALRFARAGDEVFATLRDPSKAGELERARGRERLPLEILPLDVLDAASIEAAVGRVEDAGGVDVLVNNAGIEVRGSVEETDDDEARLQFDTNVHGCLATIRAVLPAMRGRGAGTIVNVSSVAGVVARPFGGLYAASKHALEAISEALHYEVEPFGIRVVLIEPGQYATSLLEKAMVARRFTPRSPYWEVSEEFDRAVRRLVPGGERADPQEVADRIYEAVHDPTPRLRYLVGADAELIVSVYRQKSFEEFEQIMRETLDWKR